MKYAAWVLGSSSLASIAMSFTHQGISKSCLRARFHPYGSPATSDLTPLGAGDRCPTLRLASRQANGEDDASDDVSAFGQTSGPVKALVGGLTDLFLSFSGEKEQAAGTAAAAGPPKVFCLLLSRVS